MLQFERSIDIALDTKPVAEKNGTLVVVPIKSTESLVAASGLGTYLGNLYGSVLKNSDRDHDRALKAVFDFISEDVEQFRSRAHNLQNALDPENGSTRRKAYTAAGISYLLRGLRSHKTGVWLKGQAAEDQLNGVFREVMEADGPMFYEYSQWAYKQSLKNGRYWRHQLESVRSIDLIQELREAIDESDHYPREV
jgi:hypothetical protein